MFPVWKDKAGFLGCVWCSEAVKIIFIALNSHVLPSEENEQLSRKVGKDEQNHHRRAARWSSKVN